MKRAAIVAALGALASLASPAIAHADDGVEVAEQQEAKRQNVRDRAELMLMYFVTAQWGTTASFFVDALDQAPNPYASVNATAFLGTLASGPLGAGVGALIDSSFDRRRGVPTTVTTAMLLGVGEGLAWNEYFSNRSTTSFHTYTKDVATVFGFETAGLITGVIVARFVRTTPGRAAWVATTGLFGGFFAGAIAGAATRPANYPTTPWDRDGNRNVGITSAIAGIAGAASGIATATWLSPSGTRARIIDAGWIGGAFIPALACIGHCNAPDVFLAMSIGSGIGFIGTFLATAWLPKDGRPPSPNPAITFSPYAMPTVGGVTVGIGGTL